MAKMAVLEVKNIHKSFGGLVALDNVSLEVQPREIMGLVGPNGSGKTTLLNIIMGLLPSDRGDIFLDGSEISGMGPSAISRKGLVMTFQQTRLFGRMTVMENMLVPETPGSNEGDALELLKFLGIDHLRYERAYNLSYGQRKLLELARILMLRPKVMLLDEPTAGVNPVLIEQIMAHIRQLNSSGMTILLVEHNLRVVRTLCQRIVVLDQGKKIADGTPDDTLGMKRVVDAYLGGE